MVKLSFVAGERLAAGDSIILRDGKLWKARQGDGEADAIANRDAGPGDPLVFPNQDPLGSRLAWKYFAGVDMGMGNGAQKTRVAQEPAEPKPAAKNPGGNLILGAMIVLGIRAILEGRWIDCFLVGLVIALAWAESKRGGLL